MEQRESGIITMNEPDVDIHLPPGQTPITSAKRITRIRRQPATVGFVDDQIAGLARAILTQYGPVALFMAEIAKRQAAIEDYIMGEDDIEALKARLAQASAPVPPPPPVVEPEEPVNHD